MVRSLLAVSFSFIFFEAYAQKGFHHYGESYYAIGAEVNPVPYLTGGYSGTLWWGAKQVRIRGLAALTSVPGFAVPEGFEKETIQSFAILGDYFFTPAFKNLWAGGGIEYWKGGVTNSDDHIRSNYKDIMLTAGTGYIIKIWQGIYINPGAAIHLILSGDRAVETGSRIFNTNTITPELSLKIGYHYRL